MRQVITLCLAVLPLAACGGGGRYDAGPLGMVAAPPEFAAHGTASARGGQAVVRMSEDYFEPTVIRAAPGSRLTLLLENVGQVTHSFDVVTESQKVDVVVQPGRRATVHVRVPRFGRLLFFCKLHWARGMAGYVEPSG